MPRGFIMNPGDFFRGIDRALEKKMRAAGEEAVRVAKDLVAVDTGQLQASIGYVYRQTDKTLQVYADQSYAIFQEFGTARMKAHPYLRPALNAVGRVWGASTEMHFTNVPASKSSPRPQSAHNASVSRKLAKGASHRAKLKLRHVHKSIATKIPLD